MRNLKVTKHGYETNGNVLQYGLIVSEYRAIHAEQTQIYSGNYAFSAKRVNFATQTRIQDRPILFLIVAYRCMEHWPTASSSINKLLESCLSKQGSWYPLVPKLPPCPSSPIAIVTPNTLIISGQKKTIISFFSPKAAILVK